MSRRTHCGDAQNVPAEAAGDSRSARAVRISRDGIPLDRLRRRPRTKLVKLSELNIPSFEADPQFRSRWNAVTEGKLLLDFTRVPVTDVLAGFVRQGASPLVIRDPPPNAGHIRLLMKLIRGGGRPCLTVYELGLTGFPRYACADDVSTLLAYQTLGLEEVPVAIMGAVAQTTHSLLSFRSVRTPEGPRFALIRAVAGTQIQAPPAFPSETMADELLASCTDRLTGALTALRKFHRGAGTTHYHESVASFLVRAVRLVDCVGTVVGRGNGEAAVILARSLYALATSFYVDWLAPETIGQAFTTAAQGSSANVRSILVELEMARIASGWPAESAKAMTRGIRDMHRLVRAVGTRAQLTPLRELHADLYQTLSRVAHQDATTMAAFAGYLVSDLDPLKIKTSRRVLRRDASLACSTAAMAVEVLVRCAGSDVGGGSASVNRL